MKQFIIGIDPGKNGGIVGLTNGHINLITKMPQTPSEMWGYLESSGLHLLLKSNKENNTHVFIEDVHSMPRDGVRSAFTFGRQLGILDTILAYYPVAVTRVIPHKWMAFLGLQKEDVESKYNYKKRLVEEARRLAFVIDRDKLNLATADAFLIAKYGERCLENGNKEL